MRQFFIAFILGLTFNISAYSGDATVIDGVDISRPYNASDNVQADVDAILAKAGDSGKLALVVMGGNWCHDSRALAKRLHDPKLAPLMADNYETLFVDVGYLNKSFDVNKRFGMPVIYATPTVMIIDPKTGARVNADNMHQWGSADSISLEDTIAYFELMASTEMRTVNDDKVSPRLKALYEEIDAYEVEQSKRIYKGFSVVGPLLKAYKGGEKNPKFEPYWYELAKMRSKVGPSIQILRDEAKRRVEAGEENIKLDFPSYAAFSWE